MASQHETVFVITSVIFPSQKPLSYTPVRSFYTPDERVKQTIKTIESIRLHYKDAFIILLEMGLNKNISAELKSKADSFIFVGNKKFVRSACDSKHKGFGEAVGLIAAKKMLSCLGDYYFKISGRYFLTESFNPEDWGNESFIVRKYGEDISTRLYGFPKELFSAWQMALWKSIPFLFAGQQIEHVLPRFLPQNHVKYIKVLGVAGTVAPNGEFLEE